MAAIPDLSAGYVSSRFQLFDCQLSADGARDGCRSGAMDRRTAWHYHAVVVCDRHVAGCAARLAWRTALDALDDAATLGTACDPVLSAGPDPDVPAGLADSVAADLWRLYRRRYSIALDKLRVGCRIACVAPGVVHRAGGDRRMGAGHARHD